MTTPRDVLAGDARSYLHAGDALAFLRELPSASVDAVITDPPYSSGAATLTARRNASPSRKYITSGSERTFVDFAGDQRDQRSLVFWCVLWLGECLRIVRPGGVLLSFSDWRQLPSFSDAIQAAGWTWKGVGVWDKGAGARPMPNGFRAQAEYVLHARRPGGDRIDPASAPYLPGVIHCPVESSKMHMSGKPLALMQRLVELAPRDGVVLDPFVGSGTTGAAALARGRRFLGCEIVPHYCEVARERLALTDAKDIDLDDAA